MVVPARFVAWALLMSGIVIALSQLSLIETNFYGRLYQTRTAKLEAEVKDAKQLPPAATSSPPPIPLNLVSLEAVSTETSPDHLGRGKETPPKTEGCDTSPLANVSLLIHCRNSLEICEQRRSLLKLYAPFFKSMTFLLRSGCNPTGDPYLCVAQKMNKIAKETSGVLYVQFDLVFSPCMLAQQLDLQNVGVLSCYKKDKYRSFKRMSKEGWAGWRGKKTSLQSCNVADDIDNLMLKVADDVKKKKGKLAEMLRHGIWHELSDIFYIPRSAFGVFQILVPIWVKHEVFHEIALPPLLNLTSMLSGLEMKPLKCAGGTSAYISEEIILSKDFLCGHRINYKKMAHRGALQDLLHNSATAAGVSTKWGKKR